MSTFEAALRGAVIALFLVLAIATWRDARRLAVARYATLFALCGVAYPIESAPGLAGISAAWIIPIRLLSITAPAVFQLWAAANFDDSFEPAWWRWLPFAGLAALGGWAIASGQGMTWRAVQGAEVVLVGIGIWQALSGRATDLIEGRRRFRLVLAVAAGLCIGGLILLGSIASREIRALGSIASTTALLALAFAATLLALGTRSALGLAALPAAAPAARRERSAAALSPGEEAEERGLLARLRQAMETERAYRDEAFGMAMLAARLKTPEYRLRRLINQRLGHRNFISFVNTYRLAETVAALADPEQEAVPILTIALDAGFQSIGPFNRAFKAETGMTPTEYRRARLDQAEHRAAQ
ncbi:MAG: helix-turn-helix domain-containing protein [Stellaceae bacterium]